MRSLALAALLLVTPIAFANDATRVTRAHVDEALAEAGENRAQLEAVIAHYEFDVDAPRAGDAQEHAAALFLIGNMTGKGYVVTRLRDKDGKTILFDPLAYEDFKAAQLALDALEEEHGELEWARDDLVKDTQTITSEFLIHHMDEALAAWRGTPEGQRVGFEAFLNYVLPYRGSQEPIHDWIGPLRERFAAVRGELGVDAPVEDLYRRVSKDAHKRVRFNERFYLHPTDQSFGEMLESGQGRCEDITNMITFAARSVAIATAADYTPAWGHRDNNHAWNVLLDREGRGCAKSNAHAAKVYRKTYAIQRDNLAFLLPEGREAPNRFLASTSYIDVTDQYAETTDVAVELSLETDERFAYIAVFNGGKWTAIHWSPVSDGRAVFTKMGRNLVYLPAVHDGEQLVPAAAPRIVHRDGSIQLLAGNGSKSPLLANSVGPKKKSPDTGAVTPISYLKSGTTYVLKRWHDGWQDVAEVAAADEPLRFTELDVGSLYWLVANESRRLERVFTVEDGRQRWW